MKAKMDTTYLNSNRLSILATGYLRVKDIAEFIPCGRGTASKIFRQIRKQTEAEGFENCQKVILAQRILKYTGLTMEGIKAAAKLEKKEN